MPAIKQLGTLLQRASLWLLVGLLFLAGLLLPSGSAGAHSPAFTSRPGEPVEPVTASIAATTGPTGTFTTKAAQETLVYLPLVFKNHQVLQLYAAADVAVLEGEPDLNVGDDPAIGAGYDQCGPYKVVRGLVRFDLSGIPAGASISQATLYLYLMDACDPSAGTHNVTAYRASGDWSELAVAWKTQPGYAEAYGSAMIPSQTFGWYGLDVTDLLRSWADGSHANQGLVLRGPESADASSAFLVFGAREHSAATGPRIEVWYTNGTSTGSSIDGQ